VTERRQMTRYNFGAIAQVIDLDSREDVIAVTRDLSFSGCFVKTNSPFPQGRVVIVRITCLGADFAATGTVTGNITREGMGIEFIKIGPQDQAVIEQWLDPHPQYRQEHSVRSVPVITFRQANHFSDETERDEATSGGTLLAPVPPSMPGQTVRLKNRLTHQSHNLRVLPVEPEPKAHKPRLRAMEFLQSARNFWKFDGESRHQAPKDSRPEARSGRHA
jgi:PilZ domain-containing protein